MPGKVLLLLASALAGAAGTAYWLAADNSTRFGWHRDPVPQPPSDRAQPTAHNPASSVASQTALPPAPSDNALGFMLASVAQQYSQNVRYPSWSTPLSPAQAKSYRGNHYEPVSLPLGNNGDFTVTLEKYRYTRGQPILIAAAISGPQVIANTLQATLERSQTRDAVATTRLLPPEGADATGSGNYEGVIESDETPGEYRLIVEAQVDGRPVRHVSTLTIEPFLGTFEGVDGTYTANNSLVMPVRFDPDQPGFYGLSGQLYDGQRPIALLQAEKRLDAGADTIPLKAHGTVLANLETQGPLTLRHLQIRQLPARPGDRTHYAFGPEEGFSFSPPDLSNLHDTPAVDPESERRSALLKQLAEKF